jgi:hypothetical protein
MSRYDFKKQAINEGLPWNEWSYYERELYRKGVRLENARQGKIKFCNELLEGPNFQSPMERLSIQAEIDILKNEMHIFDAFEHRLKLLTQGYIEETNNEIV